MLNLISLPFTFQPFVSNNADKVQLNNKAYTSQQQYHQFECTSSSVSILSTATSADGYNRKMENINLNNHITEDFTKNNSGTLKTVKMDYDNTRLEGFPSMLRNDLTDNYIPDDRVLLQQNKNNHQDFHNSIINFTNKQLCDRSIDINENSILHRSSDVKIIVTDEKNIAANVYDENSNVENENLNVDSENLIVENENFENSSTLTPISKFNRFRKNVFQKNSKSPQDKNDSDTIEAVSGSGFQLPKIFHRLSDAYTQNQTLANSSDKLKNLSKSESNLLSMDFFSKKKKDFVKSDCDLDKIDKNQIEKEKKKWKQYFQINYFKKKFKNNA